MTSLTELPIWHQLLHHQQSIAKQSLSDLFAADPNRFQQFSLLQEDLLFDFSKNPITQETLTLLYQLADACQLLPRIAALFNGERVNITEQRAALHTALRREQTTPLYYQDVDIMPDIIATRRQMGEIATRLHQGRWLGFNGKAITDVVNIGIGGSDLGPRLAVTALQSFATHSVRCHFVANADGAELSSVLADLSPQTTLFIIASKSFTTVETLLNANSAKAWLTQQVPTSALAAHFIAISSYPERAVAWGVNSENCLRLPPWVGGRYSLWSAIGLPIAISLGMSAFESLLAGAYTMDQHFQTAPMAANLPITLALLNIWYINFFKVPSYAVLPYDHRLRYLVPYLQQLEMESNGKSVSLMNQPIQYRTAATLWGDVGTNGQHAFHQLLHQGTELIPIDFWIAALPAHTLPQHHPLLIANALGQAEALLQGHTDPLLYKTTSGNRPSNIFLFKKLDPYTLGRLIALYEHKVFVQSVIWQINCFDQWGVEYSKQCAEQLLPFLQQEMPATTISQSTVGLIRHYHRLVEEEGKDYTTKTVS